LSDSTLNGLPDEEELQAHENFLDLPMMEENFHHESVGKSNPSPLT